MTDLVTYLLAFFIANCIYDLIKYLISRKDKQKMAVVYATLIVNGKKTINDVPATIREQVKEVLIDLGLEYLAE